MNFKRILCPIDFSDSSQAVVEYARMIADSTGAEIVFLHVLLPDIPVGSATTFDPELDEQRIVKQLKQLAPSGDDNRVDHLVRFGAAADQIVRYAEGNEIDLIVLGTQGRTGLKRVLVGSVAEEVIRRAECPVLAVKSDARVLQTD